MATSWKSSAFIYLVSFLLMGRHVCPKHFTERDLNKYKDRVLRMFQHAYNGYLQYAYPLDELRPLTCDGHDTWGSYSLTLIDALDTLAIMGNYSEFRRVANVLLDTINFDKDINVSVFETNIRIVGGLLSAHLLSKRAGMETEPGWPCSGPLLRLAEKVGRKLLPAFNTSTGMPYGTVNLLYGVPKGETTITCTAGVSTFIVEFGALTRLTGDPVFEKTALRALRALWNTKSPLNLVGNHIDVATGKWTAMDSGIGAGVDSYFEYLVKGSILFQNPELMKMFKAYMTAIEKYLKREDWFMWANMNKGTITLPVFQSLDAFWPGIMSLIGEIDKGMKTLHNYHQIWKQFGFTPEFYNIPKGETQTGREGYPLRPEMVESTMYLYYATKDPYLLEVAVDILESIEHETKTPCGYSTIKDVRDHRLENRMESFFLAETTKYLYLLFDTDSFIHNTGGHGTVVDTPHGPCVVDAGGYVFNTEAHPLDTAALYCCSAQRAKDLAELQDLHDSVDLLALLDLVDSPAWPFEVKPKNKIEEEENSNNADDTDETDNVTDNTDKTVDNHNTHATAKSKDAETKQSLSGAPIEDSASGSDPAKEITGSVEEEEEEEEEEEDEDVCKPEDREEEERISADLQTDAELLEADYGEDEFDTELFQARLFTCPAQPFHMKLSLMGEMFVES